MSSVGSIVGEEKGERIMESMGQINDSVRRMQVDAVDYQRWANLSMMQIQNFQRDVDNLRLMHKRLKTYLDGQQQPNTTKISLCTPYITNNIILTDKELEKSPTIAGADIPWRIITEHPYFTEQTVHLRYALKSDSVLCSIQFNQDGSLFAFANGKNVFLVHTENGTQAGTCDIPQDPNNPPKLHTRAISFSPESKHLAISGQSNNVILFSVDTLSVISVFAGHSNTVSSLAFSNDGLYLYSGGFDGRVCKWDLTNRELSTCIRYGDANDEVQRNKNEMVIAIATSKDNSLVVVGLMNGSIVVYDAELKTVLSSFVAHEQYLMDMNASPKDHKIATSSQDRTAKVWTMNKTATCENTLEGHTDYVLSVCFSPSEEIIFTGSKDETIKGWNENTGELLFTLKAHQNTLFQIDHHPHQRTFVSCSGDGIICLWDYTMPENLLTQTA